MLTEELKKRILKEKPVLREIDEGYAQYLVIQGYKSLEMLHAWILAQVGFQGDGILTQQSMFREILKGKYKGRIQKT